VVAERDGSFVAIKRSLGKLDAPEDLAPMLLGAGVQALAVSVDHAVAGFPST
jgi:hypothetical protein